MSWDSPTTLAPLIKQLTTTPLIKHITDNMLALIAGKLPSDTTKNGYTANNYSTSAPSCTRNSNLFCRSLDLTAISVINDGSVIDSTETVTGNVGSVAGYGHPGMLISPRHIIGANHWHGKGPWIWKDKFGAYKSASLVHGQAIANTDIWIGYLDTAITTVTLLQMLPETWRNYLPDAISTINGKMSLPLLSKTVHSTSGLADQWNINNLKYLFATDLNLSLWYGGNIPTMDQSFSQWYTPISGGDSGGPTFLVINGNPVLIGTYWSQTGGDTYSDHISEIETAINTLAVNNNDDTYYSLSKVDLCKFTTY